MTKRTSANYKYHTGFFAIMPEIHIRKELYEKLVSHGENSSEAVNEILHNYIAAKNAPAYKFSADEMHLKEYHEHGNAD